jgi:NAD-dependent dihydropyrimidine dehydrogenase PreA subunit
LVKDRRVGEQLFERGLEPLWRHIRAIRGALRLRREQVQILRCVTPRGGPVLRACPELGRRGDTQIRANHGEDDRQSDEKAPRYTRHLPKGLEETLEENSVAYIITEPCVGTKDTACVDVCPVDCIHPRKDEPEFQSTDMLYIHPDECIDCGACVPACPVEAIFALDETPEKWKHFIPVNAQFFQKT